MVIQLANIERNVTPVFSVVMIFVLDAYCSKLYMDLVMRRKTLLVTNSYIFSLISDFLFKPLLNTIKNISSW